MSTYVSDIYTKEIYENLRPLFANWEPSRPIILGDYGILVGQNFIHQGNVSEFGITFEVRADGRRDQKYFASSGHTEIAFHAKGSAPVGGAVNLKASLEVKFSSDRAVFFNAAECEYTMVASKTNLGNAIQALPAGVWERGWCVVTDLFRSASTTVAVSGSATSEIIFEATGDVPGINLADASAGLTVKTARNVGYQSVPSSPGLTPLFGLCRIKPRFLWFDDDFRPLYLAADTRLALEGSRRTATEAGLEDLVFAQVE